MVPATASIPLRRFTQEVQTVNFQEGEVHLFGRGMDVGSMGEAGAREQIAVYAAHHGIKRLLAISPQQFNAKVISPRSRNFPRHDKHHGVHFHYGAYVDGIVGIGWYTAVLVRTADCPTVVLIGDRKISVLHGGLNSLITQYWRRDCRAPANRPSVVQAAIARLKTPPDRIRAWIVCGIGPESYPLLKDHPVHGEYNRRLVTEVKARWGPECVKRLPNGQQSLSLQDIIIAQLAQLGVQEYYVRPDGTDTATDKDRETGEYRWNSAARGDRERNMVLVVNRRPDRKIKIRKPRRKMWE